MAWTAVLILSAAHPTQHITASMRQLTFDFAADQSRLGANFPGHIHCVIRHLAALDRLHVELRPGLQ